MRIRKTQGNVYSIIKISCRLLFIGWLGAPLSCTQQDIYESRTIGSQTQKQLGNPRYSNALPQDSQIESSFQQQSLGSVNLQTVLAQEHPIPLGSFIKSLAVKIGFNQWNPPLTCDFSVTLSDSSVGMNLTLPGTNVVRKNAYGTIFKDLTASNSCNLTRPNSTSFSFQAIESHTPGPKQGSDFTQESESEVTKTVAYNQFDRLFCALGGEARDRRSFQTPEPWTATAIGSLTKFASCMCGELLSESLAGRLMTRDNLVGNRVQVNASKEAAAASALEDMLGLDKSNPNYDEEMNTLMALIEGLPPSDTTVIPVNDRFTAEPAANTSWAAACTYLVLHPDQLYY